MALVMYNNIVARPKDRPISFIIGHGLFIANQGHLLLQIQGQQEAFPIMIDQETIVGSIPLHVVVAGDRLAVLRADQGHRLLHIVALLVELGGVELVVGGAEEQLQSSGFPQGIVEEIQIFLEFDIVGLEDVGVDALEGDVLDDPRHRRVVVEDALLERHDVAGQLLAGEGEAVEVGLRVVLELVQHDQPLEETMRLLTPEVLPVPLAEHLVDHLGVPLLQVPQRHLPHHLLPPLGQLADECVLDAEHLRHEVLVDLEVEFEHVGDTDYVHRPAGRVQLELLALLVLAMQRELAALCEGAETPGLLLAGAAGDDRLGDVVALEQGGVELGLFHREIFYCGIVSLVYGGYYTGMRRRGDGRDGVGRSRGKRTCGMMGKLPAPFPLFPKFSSQSHAPVLPLPSFPPTLPQLAIYIQLTVHQT